MKYVFEDEISGYKKIDRNSRVNFCNDTLKFRNAKDAFRFLYYAKNNTFEIELNQETLDDKNLLRTIVRHGAKVKFYRESNSTESFLSFAYITLYFLFIRYSQAKVDFCPTLEEVKNSDTSLFILDGYYVNDYGWDYTNAQLQATHNIDNLPFKFNVSQSDNQFEILDTRDLLGANAETCKYSIYQKQIMKCIFSPKAFIYDAKKLSDGVIISVFYQGYEFIRKQFVIESSANYEILTNDDWKYYNKHAHYFSENFIKLKIYDQSACVKFSYNNQDVRIIFSRNLCSEAIFADLYFRNNLMDFTFDADIDQFKDDFYQQIELKQKEGGREIYLFQDRQYVADDNAEALYKYYMENTDKQLYFAVKKGTSSWKRLQQQGFNLVAFGSEEHKKIYLLASKLMSSHAARRIYDPFYPCRDYVNLEKFKFVFLQHGIIMGPHHGFMDKVNNKIDLLITSTDKEAELVKGFSGFSNVPAVGLARYDNYKKTIEKSGDFIIYAPSWNLNYKDNLENSVYVKEIERVLKSAKIHQILLGAKLDLYLILHPEFIDENVSLENPFNYKILGRDEFLYSEVLNDTVGIITDYSSLFFDVLYQNKFVVHHQPYELHHDNNVLGGYQDAIFESFNIGELEAIFTTLATNQFKNDDEKNKTIRKFFKYYDNKQCERTYLEIEKL